jgi:hypothetical protein
MSAYLYFPYGQTGITKLYVSIYNINTDMFANFSATAFESYNSAHVTSGAYSLAFTEIGSSGKYRVAVPSWILTTGPLQFDYHLESGSSPAWPLDAILQGYVLQWNGTAWTTEGVLTSAERQNLARIITPAPNVWFVSTAGNDSNDGLSPATAVLTLAQAVTLATGTGTPDIIRVGTGTFSQGAASVTLPAGVTLLGSGWDTRLTSSVAGHTVQLADGCTIENLWLDNTTAGFGYCTGHSGTPGAPLNAVIRRVRMTGMTDCLFVAGASSSNTVFIRVFDCDIRSQWDCVAVQASPYATVEIHNTFCQSFGTNSNVAGMARCLNVNGALLYMFGGSCVSSGGSGSNVGLFVQDGSGGLAGAAWLVGVAIECSGTGAADLSTLVSRGGTAVLTVSDCIYNPAQITQTGGTITLLNSPGHVQPATLTHSLAIDASGDVTIAPGSVTAIQTGLATSGQIPTHFTNATFLSDGVFAAASFANLPSGSDPWATNLPGAYSAGQAGYILGIDLPDLVNDNVGIDAVTPLFTVSAATSTSSFTLSSASDIAASRFFGKYVTFGAQLDEPSGSLVTLAVQGISTTVVVTVAPPLSAIPTVDMIAALVAGQAIASDSQGRVILQPSGLDAITVETGVNARQALSPILAAAAGVTSGMGSGSVIIKGGNVATTRITATTDINNNRVTIALALPT